MKFLLLLALLPLLSNALYTKFLWSDCGSRQVQLVDIDITPMPILQPGNAYLTFKANFLRAMQGPLKTTLNIIRGVNGVALPIRCYLVDGIYVGSCTYSDLCEIVALLLVDSFNPFDCPPALLPYGIDCTCPFALKAGYVEIVNQVLELPDASTTIATFLASGEFDIKIDTSDDLGRYGCVEIKFSVRPAPKPGK